MNDFNPQTLHTQSTNREGFAESRPAALQPAQYRHQEICRVAAEMYETKPHWVAFFREILGVDGVMRRLLTNPGEVQQFEQSEEHTVVQTMLRDLRRKKKGETQADDEPTRVITIRIPASMHQWLLDEAQGASTSMNKLCITKLLQVLGDA